MLPFLEKHAGLTADSVIADIGSGTGLLAKLFLEYGCVVHGVEPNEEMRQAGERDLSGFKRFLSVAGRAETTGLPAESVDIVSAGQAFHWFDWPVARRELQRILKPGGYAILVWNKQDRSAALIADYQELLEQFGRSYQAINHTRPAVEHAIVDFFAPQGAVKGVFANEQRFDLAGFRGRYLSTSTAPLAGEPDYEPALAALADLFDKHAVDGYVRFPYVTTVFVGQFGD